ncbi:hypothetical protein FO519_002663 [Halicephalobus sp. NKZ332]|nr:hypothetical protein FO519_002663 [Halicephalobus sp. NKZ332]
MDRRILNVFILSILIQTCVCDDLELVQANVLWRHGDRAPLFTYTTDLVPEVDWEAPYGEITPLGMEQVYTKGLIFRQRYVNDLHLISPTYNSSQIYVRSTDMDRTLLSAYGVLAGVYSTEELHDPISSVHKLPSRWTSVPIHTVKFETDYLMNMERICPKFLAIDRERNENPKFKAYVESIEPLFELLRNKTGLPIPDVFNLRMFQDVLRIAREKKKSLPDWVTESLYEQMDKVLNDTDDYKTGYPGFGLPADLDMINLRGGPLLKEMIENMEMMANETKGAKKLRLYSGHDITIMGRGLPNYTSAVAVELWKSVDMKSNFVETKDQGSGDTEYFVQVLFSANPTDNFIPVTRFVSGCPSNNDFCPLGMFIQRSKLFVPDDIVKLCYEF